ncbi:MAG: Cys-tRNA(Pro) deacylase [Ruminococcus sp.]|nr:Cys-tRNA(Pro) deacylase [Ruminococcus sp.]
MAKNVKTNVMRILEREKIAHEVLSYPHGKEAVEGCEVARLMGQNPSQVFKTLVARGKSGEFFVFDIPVNSQLNLKKAAASVGEKSLELTHVKDLVKICGYPRGSVSPIGMKSKFRTVFDSSALGFEKIYISAGKLGFQIEAKPSDIIGFVNADTAEICDREM